MKNNTMHSAQLINDLVTEDPNHTIRDYLRLHTDLRVIQQQAWIMEIQKQLMEYETEYHYESQDQPCGEYGVG